MARFLGTVQGIRGGASRRGSPRSGLTVTAQGWTASVTVDMGMDTNGKDLVTIRVCGGSGKGGYTLWHGLAVDLLAEGIALSQPPVWPVLPEPEPDPCLSDSEGDE